MQDNGIAVVITSREGAVVVGVAEGDDADHGRGAAGDEPTSQRRASGVGRDVLVGEGVGGVELFGAERARPHVTRTVGRGAAPNIRPWSLGNRKKLSENACRKPVGFWP